MKAIILAAGMGTRLRPLTCKIPKCLLKIGSKSILGHQLKAYENSDIDEIIVITGYKSEKVRAECELFNETSNVNVTTIQNRDFQTSDNMYSLYIGMRYHRESTVVNNADVFCSDQIFERATSNPHKSIAFYDSSSFDEEALQLKLYNGQPKSILPKGSVDGHGSTIGIFSLNSTAAGLLYDDLNQKVKAGEVDDWFENSLNDVFSEAKFEAIDVRDDYWIEVDTADELAEARKAFVDGIQ